MKRHKMSCIPFLALGLMLPLRSIADVQSTNPSHDESACSNRTLFGDYGAKIEGIIFGLDWPLCTLVLFRFDGRGSLSARSYVVLNGVPNTTDWSSQTAGTYSVKSDCTGSASIEETPTIRFTSSW